MLAMGLGAAAGGSTSAAAEAAAEGGGGCGSEKGVCGRKGLKREDILRWSPSLDDESEVKLEVTRQLAHHSTVSLV